MNLSQTSLDALRVGFSASFQSGLDEIESEHEKIATTVPSTTKANVYGWLGKVRGMKEWIGERQIDGIAEHSYTIENKSWEDTVGVDRDDIEDDNLGVYSPLMKALGEGAGAQPSEMCFGALNDGFDEICYDGQNFFDTDHPVLDKDGKDQSVSNHGGGAGTPWFILDLSQPLKPIIFQQRKAPQFVAMDSPTDANVFNKKEFLYGVDCRRAVGYAFWQMAYGSKQALTGANYEAARQALVTMTGDYGRKLRRGRLTLVVPSELEFAAIEILKNERDAAGATNKYHNTADLMVARWL